MQDAKYTPVLTDTYLSAESFIPEDNCLYIYGKSDEDRTTHNALWLSKSKNLNLIEVTDQNLSQFTIVDNGEIISLRSTTDINKLWKRHTNFNQIYLDITGLIHPVWARIVQVALQNSLIVSVLYVEPDSYSRSLAPVEGMIYDLSNTIQGISPLAGFATLSLRSNSNFAFIPLLGFEGTRLKYMVEQVQPSNEGITPVIGSPGFKPWYIFESYLGNKSTLMETGSWQTVRYAPANCPFSCFYLLHEISDSIQESAIKIAMVGTKPHALGAVLFALSSKKPTELVYDHPIRKSSRTTGLSKLLIYHISALFGGQSPSYNINAQQFKPRKRNV